MKIDSHQHFWHYNPIEYPWIGKGMEILKNDFLPGILSEELTANGFLGSVAVQARQSLAETEWLLQLSEQYPFILGVVGWIDLCSEDAENQLIRLSNSGKLVGVRHVIHDEPDDSFMLRPEFIRGLSLLQKYGMTYDLLLFPRHLPNTIRLLEQFPRQKFVIDHISKPGIAKNEMEPWKTCIREIAVFPNVSCKLSGMVTEANWHNWDTTTFVPYLDVVFDSFGTNRLMIGSDWPVCLLGGNYSTVIQIVTSYLSQFDQITQDKITGENCNKFYNLKISS